MPDGERAYSWTVIVTVLHMLSEEVEDKFEVCHLVWHSTLSPHSPPNTMEFFLYVTQFTQLRGLDLQR